MIVLKALARALIVYTLISVISVAAVSVITAPWWLGSLIWLSYHQQDRDCSAKGSSAYAQPKKQLQF